MCHVYGLCTFFVDETAIIKGESIEIVTENICVYFHRTWKHSSSDIEEFRRYVFVKNVWFPRKRIPIFLCFRCGLVVSCCVAQCNHHTWIISIVYDLWKGFRTLRSKITPKLPLLGIFVFRTFLEWNRILHAIQHAQCGHKSATFRWVSLLHSTVNVAYWTWQRGII